MIKPNIEYLAFDDRKLTYFGIPFLTAIMPLVFWGVDFETFLNNGIVEYLESMTYVTVYWITARKVIIELRKRYKTVSYTKKRLLIQAIIFIPAVPLIGLFIESFYSFIYSISSLKDACNPGRSQSILSTYFLCFTCFLLYDSIYFIQKYKEAIVEKNQLQLAHIQGQLENLRNQINPHFLFNSLNTLMNLIPMDSERAMNYLDKLSRFYRYSVSNQKQTLTSLQSELEIAAVFADLLHERFQDAIQISLPKEVNAKAQILPLSLQLLIENAVKHNIVSYKKPLKIKVELDEVNQYVWISNNVQKKIQEVHSTGMGLKNIQKRFSFFTASSIKIEEDTQQFKVGLPLIYESRKEEEVPTSTTTLVEVS
ncbi:MAG: histidine kinase [Bacteroidota bacterium]